MNRDQILKDILDHNGTWDVIIIGGGATGLGAAVEAQARGLRTLLIEQYDFAKGTSSRSTKLIHGGLRYLQQGNISLVIEALRERGLLCSNAPHLVHHRAFFVPAYHWWEGPFYGIGIKIYDLLAGKLGLEPSKHLSREEILEVMPTIESTNLRGGTVYYDGQFDDARLAICLARTFADLGGHLVNYMPMTSLIKVDGIVQGVHAKDLESGQEYSFSGRVVINATGSFSDRIRKMDDPKAKPIISHSQGVHLVLDASFLPSETALLIPHTEDGRVLFVVPWMGKVLVGTTDTSVKTPSLEPKPLPEEIEFLLLHMGKYLTRVPKKEDILSIFAGLRPLVKSKETSKTSAIARDHSIMISSSGLVTIAGGKWTTYRKMGEDVISEACTVAHLPPQASPTKELKLHGYIPNPDLDHPLTTYGSDIHLIREICMENASWGSPLHPKLPYLQVEVIWAVRYEMARTVEDVLARRTRSLLLDARASMETAPLVAKLMAQELGKDTSWEEAQVLHYVELAKHYLP